MRKLNVRVIVGVCFFAAAWLLWSGHFTPLLLAFGTASCALVTVLAWRIGFYDRDVFMLHITPRLPRYWIWIVWQVVKANVVVARVVLHPRLPVSPVLLRLPVSPLGEAGQAILGNSITLTPGTVTIDVHEGQLEVHCLTQAQADALTAGTLQRQVAYLIGASTEAPR